MKAIHSPADRRQSKHHKDAILYPFVPKHVSSTRIATKEHNHFTLGNVVFVSSNRIFNSSCVHLGRRLMDRFMDNGDLKEIQI